MNFSIDKFELFLHHSSTTMCDFNEETDSTKINISDVTPNVDTLLILATQYLPSAGRLKYEIGLKYKINNIKNKGNYEFHDRFNI